MFRFLRVRVFAMCAISFVLAAGSRAGAEDEKPAVPRYDECPAPRYPLQLTIEHIERVRLSPFVTPTATADENFVLGRTRGWLAQDECPFKLPDVPSHDLLGCKITESSDEESSFKVLLMTGNHNYEYGGFWAFQGMVDFILSDDPRAAALRRAVVFFVYPQVNPDGNHYVDPRGFPFGPRPDRPRTTGNAWWTRSSKRWRDREFFENYYADPRSSPEVTAAGQLDHNRVWSTAGLFATIDALTAAMRYDTRGEVDYRFDFHGSWSRTYYFLYPPDGLVESCKSQLESPYVRALAAHEPEIKPRLTRGQPGMSSGWARGEEGLNARNVLAPEIAPQETRSRAMEIGRSYALALYDVLLGDFAGEKTEAPADDDDSGSGEEKREKEKDVLLAAVESGDMAETAKLLEAGHNVGVRDEQRNTPLHLAARAGHDRMVTLLVTHGANITLRNLAGRRPVFLAAEAGHKNTEMLLLAAESAVLKADPESINRRTPDEYRDPHREIPDTRLYGWGVTPIHKAAGAGEISVVRLLLKYGADIHKRDYAGRDALRYAAEGGHEHIAALLLEHGAGIDAMDNSGNTPLHLAAMGCRGRLEHWATYCRGNCGEFGARGTTEDLICGGGYLELAGLLLEKGADVSAPNGRGWTPLHYSVRYGNMELVKLLIENGAEINAADIVGNTPLLLSAVYGRLEIAKLLLEHGADKNAKGQWDLTPLAWAERLGFSGIAGMLNEN